MKHCLKQGDLVVIKSQEEVLNAINNIWPPANSEEEKENLRYAKDLINYFSGYGYLTLGNVYETFINEKKVYEVSFEDVNTGDLDWRIFESMFDRYSEDANIDVNTTKFIFGSMLYDQ